jgi:GTPase SAR1 family protein
MGCIIIRGGNTEMEEVSIKKFKVVLVGFEKAGKTSILNYMKNSQFEEVTPTVALNVENIMYEQ